MVDSIIGIRKSLVKILTFFSPILVIIIVYFLKIDIAEWLTKFSDDFKKTLVEKPALGFSINTAMCILIFNIVLEIFKKPSEVSINGLNNSRNNDSYFTLNFSEHHFIKIHVDINIKYTKKIVRYFINLFGGIKFCIIYPNWVDCKIKNERDFQGELVLLVDEKGIMEIYSESVSKNKLMDQFTYINLAMISNSFDYNKGSIVFEVRPNSKYSVCRGLVNLIMMLFFDFKIKNHKVEARNDIK